MARATKSGHDDVVRLVEQADIVTVASRLGIQVDGRVRQPRRAICPFHDDKDPSLNLYRGGTGRTERDHYHCFVCGAHGDVVSLVQNYEKLAFWDAVKRLAEIEGVQLNAVRRPSIDRISGATLLAQRLQATAPDDAMLIAFAERRGFNAEFLRARGAAVYDLQNLVKTARSNRLVEEQLVEAGIVRREDSNKKGADLYGTKLREFFHGSRIVFPIDGPSGQIAGFAARSLDEQKPKYLYSYNFPRRTSLYGEGRFLAALQKDRLQKVYTAIDIYIVEGIFDVLRLEQFGHYALGILGAQLTPGQSERIERIIEVIAGDDRELRIHIFLDRDDAGRRGTYDATLNLLRMLQHGPPFGLDIIVPASPNAGKIDPDGFLMGASSESVVPLLTECTFGPLEYLASYRLDCEPASLNWSTVNRLRLASIARSIAFALRNADWNRILAPLDLNENDAGLYQFAALVSSYGGGKTPLAVSPVLQMLRGPGDDRADLLTALTLGRSSTSRREYPLDDDAWERLAVAASPLFHIHRARLEVADGPSSPLLARQIPKGDGRYRLKSGPVAHDALLQQYGLVELLRDRDECPGFGDSIPAIRYSRDRGAKAAIYRTGSGEQRQPLSFAYQIDMAIVNGLNPPKREGIFRPYFECWRSFIDFLDDRIKLFRHDEVQILRLDITGFYDHIRVDAFDEALAKPLEQALHALNATDGDIRAFAPLLAASANEDAADRAETFTKFLLSHSFGQSYFHPITGEVTLAPDARRGIPQGPDLSAYLANISLFDLDEMMEGEVERLNESVEGEPDALDDKKCAAAYARYVDDVVIICRDIGTATQLRRKIESLIAFKGLTLNRKNVVPPAMTRAEARAWITDNRAGFGFSGPLSDLPNTEAMDPLADAGEIDRRTALGLIFDAGLDNPANAVTSLVKIGTALGAADIRFNDRASAYRRLWCLAADVLKESTGTALARGFFGLIQKVEPRVKLAGDEIEHLDICLASVESLDRALRSVIPPGVFEEDIYNRIAENTTKLATCAIDNVFNELAVCFLGAVGAKKFLARYDVRCQIGIIACLAAQRVDVGEADFHFAALSQFLHPSPGSEAHLPDGLRMSLLKFDGSFDVTVSDLIVSREQSSAAVFSGLNRTLVKLQRVAAHGADEEPAPFVSADVAEPNRVISLARTILEVWTPGGSVGFGKPDDAFVELDAAATLVNITHETFARVAERRPRLMRLIAGSNEAIPLPSPPGLQASGILLKCSNGRLLLASAQALSPPPVGVVWDQTTDHAVAGVTLWAADLPTGSTLLVEEPRSWLPGQIAALYRAAFPIFIRQLQSETNTVPVPTAFSFFANYVGNTIDFNTLKLICWTAPRSSVDGHAFVRVGAALEARSVFADGADIWRFGWAVRDACNRAELMGDDDTGLDQHASVALEKDFHRRDAIVTRVLPRLSGADRWGPGTGTAENPIPTRIVRALQLLENFDRADSASAAASYLVAAVSEGMFMSERVNALEDMSSPGQPAALMARTANRASRALPEAAKHWAPTIPASLPYRRSAAAWQTLSYAIGSSVQTVAPSAAEPLIALQAGTETLGAIADLRSLAFELVASLPTGSIDLLREAEFDVAWISEIVGLDLVMLDTGAPTTDPSLASQTAKLVRTFTQIVIGQRGGLNHIRDQILPSGWVVLLAILMQIVPIRQSRIALRPTLWAMDPLRTEQAAAALHTLLTLYSTPSNSIGSATNWPWDVFDEFLRLRPPNLPELLRKLTTAARISVTTEVSRTNPRTGESHGDRPTIRLADGANLSLAEWQIDVAYIRGERGAATESYREESIIRFPYSVSRRGDQVLGIQIVSNKLAQTAFGKASISELASATAEPYVTVGEHKLEPYEQLGKLSEPQLSLTRVSLEPVAMPDEPLPAVSAEAISSALTLIEVKRNRSWTARADGKSIGAHRVALVQWDVTDSYYSPGHKGGLYEGLVTSTGRKAASPTDVKNGGVFLSTSEFRRRALIKEVLNACSVFKVDGLIFPEYSLRPETINWLSRQLQSAALPITVWCGTFRVPGGTQIDLDFTPTAAAPYAMPIFATSQPGFSRWDFHTALLTCLRVAGNGRAGSRVQFFARQKRYPSAAAGELIRPPLVQPWNPLLNDTDPFTLGTFSLELICSEMFPHASSANFIGIVEENNELAVRYGSHYASETMLELVTHDVYEFAKWTAYRNLPRVPGDTKGALNRGKALQRTLIVLPAMTNRSADYHVFGQNQYLAAGLVTAFCNAVAPHVGCGQSGFIGLDGWKQTEGIHTPYGSKAPGIFQLGGSHSGALGETEAAMVIADVDLLRTADQRPRPHYQHRALRLVAHLPIFFATEKGSQPGNGAHPNGRRQLRTRSIKGSSRAFVDAVDIIAKALTLEKHWRSQSNVAGRMSEPSNAYNDAIVSTKDALVVLEEFADDPLWLRKRTSSFMTERYDFPPMEPLPALVDWLYVDDRWLPERQVLGFSAQDDDPLMSDKPLLSVPKSLHDEPKKKDV